MLKILVTGASGFVGKSLTAQLLQQGHTVRGIMRTKATSIEATEVLVISEINGETDWTAALRDVDVVIHLAARVHVMTESSANPLAEFRKVNVEGTRHLAESVALAKVKRFVYVSSVKVNGEKSISSFTELDEPNPQDAYGVSKLEAEQVLHKISAETGLEVVIIRPPLVYGACVKGNFAQMIKVLAKGVPLPFASVKNSRSLIYVENLVDALILCVTHPAAGGQTYLVSDGQDISTPDLLRKLAKGMGKAAHLFTFPLVLISLASRFIGKSEQLDKLVDSLQVDDSKIRRELGWQTPFKMDEGLKATVSAK